MKKNVWAKNKRKKVNEKEKCKLRGEIIAMLWYYA